MARIRRLPLIEELKTGLPPTTLFELFRNEPYCFFLDSGMDPQRLGRYSFMGANPFLLLKSLAENVTVVRGDSETVVKGSPFDVLKGYLEIFRLDRPDTAVPFTGGAAGYFSYDLCHFIEKLPDRARDDLHFPEVYLGFYDLVLAYDNLLCQLYIISTGFPELDEPARLARAHERLEEIKKRLTGLTASSLPAEKPVSGRVRVGLHGNFTHQAYVKAVEKARQYIIAGDIFEVNLSQRFEADLSVPAYDLYCHLRQINPAPFSSYLDFPGITIVSASPERFLFCAGDRVETRPIKGTFRRGRTAEEDEANAQKLLNSPKDHAENMMIVDLERNDLGRVCRFGTIKVTELAILEKFPTVFHLTSTVVGRLREDKDRIDLLKAAFPGGSITGAPKVRAMEIIDELEPTRRSVYTGSIGYLSFDGNLDLNIAIRTFLIRGNRVYFQVGGAVVYDSDPEAEYQETLDKARALIQALNIAAGRK